MTGRRVVVTGGGRGIGRAIAERFRADGDRVVVVDRTEGEDVVVADLADHDAARSAVREGVRRLGGLDVLVNNAGIFSIVPLLEITPDEWDRTMTVNLRAMVSTMQEAVPVMAPGSAVVNVASMGGKQGEPGQAHYAASKAGVISLTRVAAMEFGGRGIRVNCVCPGYVLTELAAGERDADQVAAWRARSPLGSLTDPDDVAATVAWLSGPDAGALTGEAVNVAHGLWMT